MPTESFDDVVDRIRDENMAQSILNHLKALFAKQARVRTRWVWELLQNAHDAGADVVSVKHDEDKVVFRHNGASFTGGEIAHLIYHGSTKTEDAETIGQYGSGFLTTHLLSPKIMVSGGLDDGRRFDFPLKREVCPVDDLIELINRSRRDFQNSLAPSSESDALRTEFIYPLGSDDSDANDAAEEGIAMLKRYAPFVVVFNRKFSSIEIESRSETTAFKATRRCPLAKERGLHEVVVEEAANQKRIERKYIVAQGESAQVAIPVESDGGDTVCAPIREIPKLFLGFPLIGTEDFGFPAIINSLDFTPTEDRDGVFLGLNENDDANVRNQKVIGEARDLLVDLAEFAASSGWRNVYELANVPQTGDYGWLNAKWLETNVRRPLVEKIRETALVVNESGAAIPTKAAKLPFADAPEDADAPESVETLWDILAEWKDQAEALPRREEAVGWRDAVESWSGSFLPYPEARTGNRAAEDVDKASIAPSTDFARYDINRLQLKEGVCAIAWLDGLNDFLIKNGSQDSAFRWRIVPSQAGLLHRLPKLLRDAGIDEELKDIADLADDWRVRPQLRDVRIASLSDRIGAGVSDNDDVVRTLIANLKARADKEPDEICFEASARLFAWIAGRQDWNRLRELPIFSAEYEAANRQTTRSILNLTPNQRDLPLAPIASWSEDIQGYSELFPGRHTLADFYFKAVPDRETWDALDREGFVRKSVIVKSESVTTRFRADDLPDDEDEHRTSKPVPVTNVAFMTEGDIGIMARARQSGQRARQFWGFVTEWLVKEDPSGLEISQASCVCDDEHGYYPAEWIAPLRENRWIRVEGSRSARQADAQSLANLLRGKWSPNSLNDNPAVAKLLDAMGLKRFDLTRAFMASTDEERAEQDRIFTNILASTGGDLTIVNRFAEDLKNDDKLIAHLDERRKRLQVVHGNQRLGEQVEELVRQNLENADFNVKRTGIGSDFEIDDAASLELASAGTTWFVEVKATRDERVRMTDTQARTAVKKKDKFLLCVVPLDSEQTEPGLDDVRKSMRFVQNIGERLADMCKDLDSFQNQRDKITKGDSNGVRLEVESGAAKVRVANSVWQDDGFPLDDLRDNLK